MANAREIGSLIVMKTAIRPVGDLLHEWRQRRRMRQIDLALASNISARHLSFVETGWSKPSRAILLRLADRLEAPMRKRNALLLSLIQPSDVKLRGLAAGRV